jgi:hypothetical protein
VAEVLPLSNAELRVLDTLRRHRIRFMIVGLSAAASGSASGHSAAEPQPKRRAAFTPLHRANAGGLDTGKEEGAAGLRTLKRRERRAPVPPKNPRDARRL